MNEFQRFRIYYNHTIYPELVRMEQRRKQLLWLLFMSIFLLAGVVALEIYISVLFVTLFLSILLVAYIFYLGYLVRQFVQEFKPKVINLILGFMGLQYFNYDPKESFPRGHFINSRIFSSSAPSYMGEDYISGRLGEVDFEMGEIEVKEFSLVRSRLEGVFQGVMLRARFQEHLEGNIYILPEEHQQHLVRSIKQFTREGAREILLESEAFEEIFMVYSNQPHLVMRLLTPEVQHMLVDFRKRVGKEIYISFVQHHIYIAITEERDLLEPHVFQANDDFYLIREFYEDLQLFFSILREFDKHTITSVHGED